jgi:hypothetical protein
MRRLFLSGMGDYLAYLDDLLLVANYHNRILQGANVALLGVCGGVRCDETESFLINLKSHAAREKLPY